MTNKSILTAVVCASMSLLLFSAKPVRTIFIIGDSTAANKENPATNPERGWGMLLQSCFDSYIDVDNHAKNGRSSLSFINEGRWDAVLKKIKPGDYVIIQFGHNDEKPGKNRHTDPGSTFDANLEKFVRETRERKGIPIIMNAVVRRNFYDKNRAEVDDESLRSTTYAEEKINSDTLIDTHGAYIQAPKQVALKTNTVFIDANRITHDIEQSMGVVGSRKLHMWFKPGEVSSIPKGRQDNTHYNVYGAKVVADALVLALVKELPELKKHYRYYNYIVSEGGFGNYLTLADAFQAVPVGKKATIYVLDKKGEVPPIPRGKRIKLVYRHK